MYEVKKLEDGRFPKWLALLLRPFLGIICWVMRLILSPLLRSTEDRKWVEQCKIRRRLKEGENWKHLGT
jgi:hypothetical protein